jgi:hypothetical protein
VLGTTSYRRGYDATAFRPKLDAGLGWLKGGEDGIPQICRTYYLDLPATDRIATRAQLRSKGVPSVMVSVSGAKARGCRRVAIERESAR